MMQGFEKEDNGGTPSADLEKKAKELGVPVIPKLPKNFPPAEPNPVVAVCGECGMEMRQIMWYCCQNPRCPCKLHTMP